MVHTQNGFAQSSAQRAGHTRTHQQGTRQTRSPREAHHVHVFQTAFGLGQYLLGQWKHTANVVAAGQLGHHATVGLVHVDLAVQRMRQQCGHTRLVHFHQRHTGFVAGRLDAQHQTRTHRSILS